ncbi:MAG: transporter [Pyrinomonadaceae bacterium]|nr:transporter [Pyrinomonadaceae bacterium]
MKPSEHFRARCATLVGATLLLIGPGLTWRVAGQQLEPRAYSVSPVGTNIVAIGYGRSTGDIAFDPSLPVTDAKARINGALAGYFRSIDLFGRSANVSIALPYTWGNLQGNVAGQFQQARRSGLGDPAFRFAVNLYGAPAMDLKKFAAYRQKTIIGASVVVVAPLGQYDPAKLINLGGNRWAFKPEIGISRAVRKMYLDFYLGAWLFTPNNNSQGRLRKQDPIASSQFHLSYNAKPKVWVAFDATFYAGGRTSVNGVRANDLQRNSRVGGTVSYKLDRRQSVKFAYSRGAFTTIGADYQAISVAYQYLWGRGL